MNVTTSKPIPVVRIKIAAEQGARRNSDTRDLIGYRDGLDARQLWNRGREAWKMRAEKVLGCELLLISHGGIIRMVGTVEGIRKHEGGRLGIEGTPIPDHPLIGQPDPLHNTSQNPVAYGTISLS
jgi:broad specificity phosphatase PhoE